MATAVGAPPTPKSRGMTWGDFCPYNKWEELNGFARSKYFKDQTTGKEYIFPKGKFRIVTQLSFPILVPVAGLCNIAYRIYKLVCVNFFFKKEGEPYNLSARLIESGKDVTKLVCAPIAVVLLELFTLYSFIRFLDGSKLIHNIEELAWGDAPDPIRILP